MEQIDWVITPQAAPGPVTRIHISAHTMLGMVRIIGWAMVGAFVWGLMVLVLIIELVSTRIRRKLAHGA